MAVRLKTKWHRSKRSDRNRKGAAQAKTLVDLSSVIGINIWKLAKEAFTHMEKEGYRFKEDQQTMDVVFEFMVYQLQIVDRLLYGKVSEEERSAFINALAQDLLKTIDINQIELFGPGDYIAPYIERMNERLSNYSDCEFNDKQPSYDFTRYLAQCIAEHMKISDDKWVVEQVIDIEAPVIIEKIVRVTEDVLGLRNKKPATLD